jgi:hypothetical protein
VRYAPVPKLLRNFPGIFYEKTHFTRVGTHHAIGRRAGLKGNDEGRGLKERIKANMKRRRVEWDSGNVPNAERLPAV